jgi:rhamnose utilization protein RhaD (predicted bifunctional aldolase and dehydrogenase)/NAD(P)-dependent dehydrogenase (short-subunit alcohol dehydrogenase family)
MKNKFMDKSQLLNDRVNTSNLLGQNNNLVLHGGGNTSVKVLEKNLFGELEEILYVKGSGWDLQTITIDGFSPVKLKPLLTLAKLDKLSDSQMVNELLVNMTKAKAPTPSVEAILHAIIPFKFVDHTHADSFIAISNSINGEEIIKNIYGKQVLIIPYVMPGFDLAKLCLKYIENGIKEGINGILLLNHGIFSFGDTAEESYDNMLNLVEISDAYLRENVENTISKNVIQKNALNIENIALLRKEVAKKAGKPMLMMTDQSDDKMNFCLRDDLLKISQSGPATPDHVIRTKRIPMIGRNLDTYSKEYENYFNRNSKNSKSELKMLDPAPRVILDTEFGLCTIGSHVKEALIVKDIYTHTIKIINQATELGGYKALPESDIFDIEYWELEQAKLKNDKTNPMLLGRVAIVTGAASGIGKATVETLLKNGATVVGLDINQDVILNKNINYFGIVCDLTNEQRVEESIYNITLKFGGIDILILNAGIFPKSEKVSEIDFSNWEKVLNVNLNANVFILKHSFKIMKHAVQDGGNVIVVGSKNVSAPGPGAAAYSASKAALNQLARVVALEWASSGIRVNIVHPNAVFDTGIWSEDILNKRAENYHLSVDEYKKNNLLKTEIKSIDVAELIVQMCSPSFSKTTGAQISIDGGNERVI